MRLFRPRCLPWRHEWGEWTEARALRFSRKGGSLGEPEALFVRVCSRCDRIEERKL